MTRRWGCTSRKTRLDLVVEYSIYMGMSMIQMRGVMFLV